MQEPRAKSHELRAKLLALLLAAALPGLGALGGSFFLADDGTMILKSPYVGENARPLWEAFTTARFSHYAPVHEILIYIQRQLFGENPLGFRLVSILLHFGAAAGCWRMLRNLTGSPDLAYACALLWAAHPAQCESVAWAVEQKTLWSGLCSFWAIAVYTDTARSLGFRVGVAVLLAALACLAKATAISVATLLVLFELLVVRDWSLEPRLWRPLPFVFMAAVFAKVAFWAFPTHNVGGPWGVADFVLNLPGTILLYLKVALLPWTASYFHDLERVTSAADPRFFTSLVALLAIAAACYTQVARRRRTLAVFCVLGYVGAMGPMLNISKWTFPAYDRYQYLALPFALLLVGLVIEGWLERRAAAALRIETGANRRRPAMLIACALFAVIGVLSAWRGSLFADEADVTADAARKAPNNAYAHAAFAISLVPKWQQAVAEKRVEDQRRYLDVIVQAAEKARTCWNFAEYFPLPAHLLLGTGDLLRKSGEALRAEAYFHIVMTEPRWTRFKSQIAAARRNVCELELEWAEARLKAAQNGNATPDKSAALTREALEAIARARALLVLLTPEDGRLPPDLAATRADSYWLEHIAHRWLDKLAEARSDLPAAQEHFKAARAALENIPPGARFHAQAQTELARMKPP